MSWLEKIWMKFNRKWVTKFVGVDKLSDGTI